MLGIRNFGDFIFVRIKYLNDILLKDFIVSQSKKFIDISFDVSWLG